LGKMNETVTLTSMPSRSNRISISGQSDRDSIQTRLTMLEGFGGLTDAGVQNTEWLYMLEEDTRQSLAIEGYFATETELKAVLGGRKSAPEIQNYYRTALTLYDQALQTRREDELVLYVGLVRHVHSELFRELSTRRGEFRKGAILIQGAKVKPPALDLEQYIRAWIDATRTLLDTLEPIPALARSHALFESIHPFEDGNGRAGRILLNYLSIGCGLPPIVIKGFAKEDRERYYAALEAADAGFHQAFPAPKPKTLLEGLERGDFTALEALLVEGVRPRLDVLIAAALERREPLLALRDLALQLGVQEVTLRQWVLRDKLIAVKRGKRLYSHAKLRIKRI
jgi:fido (protein-threonine AMPylation protein)